MTQHRVLKKKEMFSEVGVVYCVSEITQIYLGKTAYRKDFNQSEIQTFLFQSNSFSLIKGMC